MLLRRRRPRRSGAEVLELAITLPVLLLLMLGIMEIGSIFFIQHNMYQAAREAARTMAVQEATTVEAKAKANSLLAPLNLTFTVNATEVASDAVVTISVDKDSASFGDPLHLFSAGNLTAKVTMLVED